MSATAPGRSTRSRIGLSTYAFFWRSSERVPSPLSLEDMLRETAALGGTVFQICDYAPIEQADAERLEGIRSLASELDIELELGTRGTDPAHLRRYLAIAAALDAHLLRSMWTSGDDRPDGAESVRRLREILPELEAQGVVLALETYEQVSSTALVDLVNTLHSPFVGICLDPANTVANFELPADVTTRCEPYVVNWHVKDFDFSRNPGWVGFVYTGTALGDGRLDYDGMREQLRPDERGINQIVEFWLPWQESGTPDEQAQNTVRLEAGWTATTLEHLRSRNS